MGQTTSPFVLQQRVVTLLASETATGHYDGAHVSISDVYNEYIELAEANRKNIPSDAALIEEHNNFWKEIFDKKRGGFNHRLNMYFNRLNNSLMQLDSNDESTDDPNNLANRIANYFQNDNDNPNNASNEFDKILDNCFTYYQNVKKGIFTSPLLIPLTNQDITILGDGENQFPLYENKNDLFKAFLLQVDPQNENRIQQVARKNKVNTLGFLLNKLDSTDRNDVLKVKNVAGYTAFIEALIFQRFNVAICILDHMPADSASAAMLNETFTQQIDNNAKDYTPLQFLRLVKAQQGDQDGRIGNLITNLLNKGATEQQSSKLKSSSSPSSSPSSSQSSGQNTTAPSVHKLPKEIALHTAIVNLAGGTDFSSLAPLLTNHDIEDTDGNGNNAVHIAVQAKNYALLKYILDKYDTRRNLTGFIVYNDTAKKNIKDRINTPNNQGKTSLHLAVTTQNLKIAELLLKNGGDLNQADADGNTCLHLAVLTKNPDLVKWVLEQGGNPDKADEEGYLLLHRLVEMSDGSNDDIQIFQLLNQSTKTQINETTKENLLHVISKNKKAGVSFNKNILIHLLLDTTLLESSDKNGDLPIHAAARNNNLGVIIAILKKYPTQVNGKNSAGDLPIHVAVRNNSLDVIAAILTQDPSQVNSKNDKGQTPLHIAVTIKENVEDLIFCLNTKYSGTQYLDMNAVNDKDQSKTALHIAYEKKNSAAVTTLITMGAKTDIRNKEITEDYPEGKLPHESAPRNNEPSCIWITLQLIGYGLKKLCSVISSCIPQWIKNIPQYVKTMHPAKRAALFALIGGLIGLLAFGVGAAFGASIGAGLGAGMGVAGGTATGLVGSATVGVVAGTGGGLLSWSWGSTSKSAASSSTSSDTDNTISPPAHSNALSR